MTKNVNSLGVPNGEVPPSGHPYHCTCDWERYKCAITIISGVAGAGLIGLGLYNYYFWQMKASALVVLPITLGGIGMIPSFYSFANSLSKWFESEAKAKVYAQKGADIFKDTRHDPTTLEGACKTLDISLEQLNDRKFVEHQKFFYLDRNRKMLIDKKSGKPLIESPVTAGIKLLGQDLCTAYETIKRHKGWGKWEDSPEFEDFTKDSADKELGIAKID